MNTYDHHAAIYLLLLERLRTRSASQENNMGLSNSQLNGTQMVNMHSVKHPYPTLEQQRRRPSSIAEQAMRKLGISNNHSSPLAASTEIRLDAMPSMLTLRDTSIREQSPSPTATVSSALHYLRDSNGRIYGGTPLVGLCREQSHRDFQAPHAAYGSMASTGHESSCFLSREMSLSGCYPNRASSNRLLMSAGIDQRIIKQSTEDCRRLLLQVNIYYSWNILFIFVNSKRIANESIRIYCNLGNGCR